MVETAGAVVLLVLILVFEFKQNDAKKKTQGAIYKFHENIEDLVDNVKKNGGRFVNGKNKRGI